ncbi:MAG: hypothetical protein K8I60_22530 [Anaerolineae bacterium]|nr:hypothetical protein [Anaerolineae bacterium]
MKIFLKVVLFFFVAGFVIFFIVYAQSANLTGVMWDGANHVVFGSATAGNYSFTFTGAHGAGNIGPTYLNGNFILPFGGLPEPLPGKCQNLNVYINSPITSNTVSCFSNSEGYCAPDPDPDGDGVTNCHDDCPGEGSVGFGVDLNGCPIKDGDGDGFPDNTDGCPTLPGGAPNGCPPGATPRVITETPGGTGCEPNCSTSVIVPTSPPPDYDGDHIPDNADSCPYAQGPGDGCPYFPDNCQIAFWNEKNTNIRSSASTESSILYQFNFQHPPLNVTGIEGDWYQVDVNGEVGFIRNDAAYPGATMDGCGGRGSAFADAIAVFSNRNCTLEASDPAFNTLRESPDYVSMLIAYSSSPCDTLVAFEAAQITSPYAFYTQLIQRFRDRQSVIDEIAICDPSLIPWLTEILNDDKGIYGIDINQLLNTIETNGLCQALRDFKNNGGDLQDHLSQKESALVGTAICGNPQMTSERYQGIVSNIVETWNIPASAVNCSLVDQVTQIGNPTATQRDLFNHLRNTCLMPEQKAFSYLQEAIARDKVDSLSGLTSCSPQEIEDILGCPGCEYDLKLEGEDTVFEACIVNNHVKKLIGLFISNHKAGLSDQNKENIYGAADPCNSAIYYMDTGFTSTPLVLPPPIPTPTSTPMPESTGGVVPTFTPEASPTGEAVATQAIPLFDNILEPSFFGAESTFVRRDGDKYSIYVIQNGEPVLIDDDVLGSKHYPILIEFEDYTLLAYLLEADLGYKLRLITLDINLTGRRDIRDLTLDVPPSLGRIAFISPYIIYGGEDGNLHTFMLGSDEQSPMLENARNPAAIRGYNGVVFERTEANGHIFLWLNGASHDALDANANGVCKNPIASQVDRNAFVWFVCDEETIYTLNLFNQTLHQEPITDPGDIINISLSEFATDLFVDDENDIYLYTRRSGEPVTTQKSIGGSNTERSLQISIIQR